MNKIIDPLSATSLYIEISENDKIKATATGFVVNHNGKHYLITNRHVVHPKEFRATSLLIYHHGKILGTWNPRKEELFLGKEKKWLEHPKNPEYDVIALPINLPDEEIKIYDLNLNLSETDMIPEPAMPVSIIGYPAGMRTGVGFPIWKTGHIASDPDLNFDNKPLFLIDATTRGGMSGSPVILRLSGGFKQRNGNRMMVMAGASTKLLGIYSGRQTQGGDSLEIGFVWRPSVIFEILNQ